MICPNIHDELQHYLKYLADSSYQQRAWVGMDRSEPICTFDYIFNFMIDEMVLHEEADECIGIFLRNVNEATHVAAAAKALVFVVRKYGGALKDSEYITKPEWQAVLDTAKAALAVVSAPEPKTHPSVVELVKLMETKQDGPPYAVAGARRIIREGYRARETDPDYFDKPAWQKSLATAKAELAAAPDAEPR